MFDQETINQFEDWKKDLLEIIEELKETVEKAECTKDKNNPNRLAPGRMWMLLNHIAPITEHYKTRGWRALCDAVEERGKRIAEILSKQKEEES